MPVSQIVYLSRATMHVARAELVDITNVSVVNNRAAGVTGALLFCDGYFLQILEGAVETIDRVLARIVLDERHSDVQVIQRRDNVERSFATWDMACLHEASMSDADSERTRACIALIQNDKVVDRIGNDAHQLLVELRGAIGTETHRLDRTAA